MNELALNNSRKQIAAFASLQHLVTLYKKGNFLILKLLYFTETSHPNFILNLVKFFNKMM